MSDSELATGEPRRPAVSPLLAAAGLLLLTVLTFLPVVGHDFVEYDDPEYVTDNPRVRAGLSWDGVRWASKAVVVSQWYPLTLLSHMLDVELFGLDARGHHLTSLLLHTANTLLLFWVLWRMTAALGRSAWVAAAFGVHPTHVESVAWIAERKDVLSAFFWILAMALYLRFARHPSARRWTLVALAFALGLLAKPMVVTLPLALLLLDVWPLGRWLPLAASGTGEAAEPAPGRPAGAGRLIAEKLPLLAMAAIVSLITVRSQSPTLASIDRLPLGQRLENAITGYAGYLGKLAWPRDLAVFYPATDGAPTSVVLLAALLLAAITAAVVWLARRAPYLPVGWLWFVGVLFPVCGLFQIGSHGMADRYTYLPSIGLFAAVAWGVTALIAGRRGAPNRRARTAILATAGFLTIGALAVAAHRQAGVWADSETLFRHAARVTENNYVAHLGLAHALQDRGAPPSEALPHFQAAIQAAPTLPTVHGALGAAWIRWDQPDRALPHLQTALRLDPRDPRAYHALAAAVSDLGDDPEAIVLLERALEHDPDYLPAHQGLTALYAGQDNLERAQHHAARVLELSTPN